MTGKALEMHPFNALRVPRMVIELKQALVGSSARRRTPALWRCWTARARGHVRRNVVIPSLPPAQLTSRIELVQTFSARSHRCPGATAPPAEMREEKRSKAKSAPAVTVNYSEEIPF